MTVYAHTVTPRLTGISVRTLAFWVLIALSAFGLWTLQNDFLPVALAFPGSTVLDLIVVAAGVGFAVVVSRRFLRPVQAPPWSGSWLALMWGAFAAPRARFLLPTAAVVAVKVFAFGCGALALWGLGFPLAAVAFAVLTAANLTVTTYVRTRPAA